MGFRCDPATLGRLEWTRLTERLAERAATARGAESCRRDLFEGEHEAVCALLTETTEARGLLDSGEEIPFGGVADLRAVVEGAARGRLQGSSELAEVLSTLQAGRRIRSFLSARGEQTSLLGRRARAIPELPSLERELARALTPEGEIREDATPELRRARRRVRELEAEIERRMAAQLRDPSIAPHLQDHYTTIREGRPVLPVRADARSRVRGIVHDVSSSGTTVFVEPEDVVEAGNRLRIARTELQREIEKILRALTDAVGVCEEELAELGRTLEALDFAMARGRLSQSLDACAPEVGAERPLALRLLHHPLLLLEGGLRREEVVPNDFALPEGVQGLIISGPNAGGKTVAAKAVGLAALAVRAGLHVPCAPGSTMPLLDAVFCDIGDEQDLRTGLSTFSARMTNLARIVAESGPRTLVILDEMGEGTEPGEGAAIAQAVLEVLVEKGARVVVTTHFNRLKELAGHDSRFFNASAEFDSETLLPTYRIHLGIPGSSGACWVAERMGVPGPVVERARGLLDGQDRKLEALTRTLSELRQELEAERRLAVEIREETESVRTEYETRLRSLRSAREKALASMKADLEAAFRSAREEVAGVVRALQRGERPPGRAADQAHRALASIRERTEAVERAHADRERPERRDRIDWARLEEGTRLQLEGVAGEAVLLEPPGPSGRLTVRLGAVRMSVPSSRVVRVVSPPREQTGGGRVEVERAPESITVPERCDLRGLRVDEALDRADLHLQRALGTSLRRVVFIHGHGTGALRAAIRSWLSELPYLAGFEPGGRDEGGDGVTVAILSETPRERR